MSRIGNLFRGFAIGEAHGRASRAGVPFPAELNIDGRAHNSWGDHTDHILAVLAAIHVNRDSAKPVKYNDIYKNIAAKFKSSNNSIILQTDLAKMMSTTNTAMRDFSGQLSGQTFYNNYDAIPRAIVAGCLSRFRSRGYVIALHMCKITHNSRDVLWSFIFVARLVSALIFNDDPLGSFDTVFRESISKISGNLTENLGGKCLCVFPEINRCVQSLREAIPLLDPDNYERDANALWLNIIGEHVVGDIHSDLIGGLIGAIAAVVLNIAPESIEHLPMSNTLGIIDLFDDWHGKKNT